MTFQDLPLSSQCCHDMATTMLLLLPCRITITITRATPRDLARDLRKRVHCSQKCHSNVVGKVNLYTVLWYYLHGIFYSNSGTPIKIFDRAPSRDCIRSPVLKATLTINTFCM